MKDNNLSGIQLVKSVSEIKNLIRSGPMHQFPIVKYIDREKGTIRRLIVFSQGKRSTLVHYLWGKFLWDELNHSERDLFLYLKESTEDLSIYLSLKTQVLGVPKRLIRERLEKGSFLGLKFISRRTYLGIKGQCDFFYLEEEISLRKVPKYSGYTKHYKDKGSMRPDIEIFIPEPEETFCDISEDVIFKYLTVGEIPLFQGGVTVTPKMFPRRNETDTQIKR